MSLTNASTLSNVQEPLSLTSTSIVGADETWTRWLEHHVDLQHKIEQFPKRHEGVCPACKNELEGCDLGDLCRNCDCLFDVCLRCERFSRRHESWQEWWLQSLGTGPVDETEEVLHCVEQGDAEKLVHTLQQQADREFDGQSPTSLFMKLRDCYRDTLFKSVLDTTPLPECLVKVIVEYIFQWWFFYTCWPRDNFSDPQDCSPMRCYWRCRFCRTITSTCDNE